MGHPQEKERGDDAGQRPCERGIAIDAEHEAESGKAALARIRKATNLPIAVGFGIRTPAQAGAIAGFADAAVVGSAIVSVIGDHPGAGAVTKVTELCRALADSIHAAANDRVGA